MNKEYKILEVEWRSALHTVGIVAYECDEDGTWNAVLGYVPQVALIGDLAIVAKTNADFDAQYIAAHGAKLSWKEAMAFFPKLDIAKYKYYPDNLKEKPKENKENAN